MYFLIILKTWSPASGCLHGQCLAKALLVAFQWPLCATVDLALCLLNYEPPLWALLILIFFLKPYLQVHWGLRLQNTISRAGNLVPSKWRALCATKVFCLFVSLCLKNVLKAFLCRSDLLKFWKSTLFADWMEWKGKTKFYQKKLKCFRTEGGNGCLDSVEQIVLWSGYKQCRKSWVSNQKIMNPGCTFPIWYFGAMIA